MEINENMLKLLNYTDTLDRDTKNKINEILEKVNSLDNYSKQRLLKQIINHTLSAIDKIEISLVKQNCEEFGHLYSEWEYVTYIVNEGISSNKFKRLGYWKRKCTKCHLVDVSSVDPNEIKTAKSK